MLIMLDGTRLNKTLSRAGICSRREADRYIEAGRVKVNGVVACNLAHHIHQSDKITVDGKAITIDKTKIFAFYKPVGFITTRADSNPCARIFDCDAIAKFEQKTRKNLIAIGRLDINSEGLLLLTNDGALAHELEKSNLPRDYRVRVFGNLELERIAKLQKGAVINGVRYQAVKLKAGTISAGQKSQNQWLEMSLIEGKNREIRKMIEWCGGKVNRLIRTRFGSINLENLGLKPGELQPLTDAQAAKLFQTINFKNDTQNHHRAR